MAWLGRFRPGSFRAGLGEKRPFPNFGLSAASDPIAAVHRTIAERHDLTPSGHAHGPSVPAEGPPCTVDGTWAKLCLGREAPVSPERVERKLAAILAADVAGYSRLMGEDEEGTLARLKAHRKELIDPQVAEHRGRIVKTTGDGILIEFPSVVDAVRCAIDVQRGMAERGALQPEGARIEFRIGINLGDIIIDGDDIHGDGVNIAARLEGLAEAGGICISQTVLNHTRGKLTFDVEDLAEQALKNISRPVHVYRILTDARQGQAVPRSRERTLALPDKPSIAVLPFQNMSGDPEQDYFADGMVEEITTALSRIRWLFVIARNSSFTYKGQAVDVKQVGRELGVRYVLEGSIRKAGKRIRITGQLIDAINGAHLWADHFDGSLEDVFELQDSVASSVAGVIEPTLQAAEISRSIQRPTSDRTAYDLYLRALSLMHVWEKEPTASALALLQQAIERDAHFGPGLALAAACHQFFYVNGWSQDPKANRHSGINMARRALRAAPDDPVVLATAAYALAVFGEDTNAALSLVDQALALNPSYATGWVRRGWLRLHAGQPDMAIGDFETSLRLSPRAHTANPRMAIGVAHFFSRRFEDATHLLLRSLQEQPGWAPTYRFLASCYAHMGLLDEARDTIRELRGLTNVVVPSAEHWKPELREFFLEGLRLAAGEKR
jgi:TolB-like protein/class 3 adenylate cyclase